MTSRITKVALAVVVFFLMTTASFAQTPWWQGNDNDRWGNWGYQNGRDNAYDRGVRDGREDREHGRNWHPRNQGQAYLNGYRAGFGQNGGGWQGRRNDHDGDEAYRGGYNGGPYRNPNGTYGNYPYGGYGGGNAQSLAYNNGYQNGLNYGAADRNNGHSFRPTYSSTYQHGTSGYNSSMGSETAYKNAFRQGYQAGYQRGYGGGYGGGRRY